VLLIGWKRTAKTMNKITTIIGCGLAGAFLIGLATTLSISMMIGFKDVLPVYILYGLIKLYDAL
jgi:hypothetical protein